MNFAQWFAVVTTTGRGGQFGSIVPDQADADHAIEFCCGNVHQKPNGSPSRSYSVRWYMSRINCLSQSRWATFRRANIRCCVLIMTSAGSKDVCPNSLA